MKKIYIFYFSFIIAILISTIAIGQVVVFGDNFDTYLSNQQISCQAPTIWKTWTNNPCNPTEDAYVSNVYSFSGINSVVIKQNNDIVKEIGTPISSGIAEINFQVYIPAGKSGYFNTLGNFNPPTYAWAMQVFLNATGTGTIDAGGANAATFSYPQNQWFPIKIVADLTADSGKFYLNGNLVRKWRWTAGTFGSTITKQLDGNDFYGYVATDEMYIDDYNIVHTPFTSKVTSTATGGAWNLTSTWINGNIPIDNQTVEIVTGATVTLDGNITNRNSSTLVGGTLNCGTYTISGSGNFVLSADATLLIGSENGISLTGATGNIQVTGIRAFNQFANYIYSGSTDQITGNGLPETVNNLTINNSSGLTLSSNISISGILNLGNSNLVTNSNTLSIGTSISNLGSLLLTSGKVIGNLRRWFSNSVVPNALFPVGTSQLKYTPITLNNIIGNGTFTVSALPGKHPNASGTNVLQMYWKLTNGGITSTDLIFNYLDADVVGDETQYEIGRYNGSWVFPSPIILDALANTVRINGMNSFSDWTLGEPTALPVELSSFNANAIGKSVVLNWVTSTEINNYGFDVERASLSDSPIKVWEMIGFVNGSGNSNSPKNYSFIDDQIDAGKPAYQTGRYSYRLKQIDNDGTYSFSKSIEVDITLPKKFELNQNYPNPFNPTTTIGFNLQEAGIVKLTLFNILGQELRTLLNEYKESGVHTINLDASNLNSGMYLYKLETGSFTQTRKMTLVK